jgi:MOSC domain-containing protein YiiM
MTPCVVAVHRSSVHSFSKPTCESIRLLEGLGVEGDAHCGALTKHRGRLPRDAAEPNLRQVHLLRAEPHDDLRAQGFAVDAGLMGENVTTRGLILLDLPRGARLHLGAQAVVELTGLRNPCRQLDGLQPGLMAAARPHDRDGEVIRLAGVMSVVVRGGWVRGGDPIVVELPPRPHDALEPV